MTLKNVFGIMFKPFTSVNHSFNTGAIFAHAYMLMFAHILLLPVFLLKLNDKDKVVADISEKVSKETTAFYYALIIATPMAFAVQYLFYSQGLFYICAVMFAAAFLSFLAHASNDNSTNKFDFIGYGTFLWMFQSLMMMPNEYVAKYLEQGPLVLISLVLVTLPFLVVLRKKICLFKKQH